MNRKILNALLAPNTWFAIFCIVAIAGIGLGATGRVLGSSLLTEVGLCLVAPLLFACAALVLFVIPFLIWDNRRLRRKAKEGHRR